MSDGARRVLAESLQHPQARWFLWSFRPSGAFSQPTDLW